MPDVGGDEDAAAGLKLCDRDAGTATEPPAAPSSRQNRSTTSSAGFLLYILQL